MIDGGRLAPVLALLSRLHAYKDAAYGDSWRKRGELMSIFPNIARKYDRLAVAMVEQEPAAAEPIADTAADLCVYGGKYLTWLAETQPQAFSSRPPHPDADEARADRGPEALDAVFEVLAAREEAETAPPESTEAAWRGVEEAFGQLELGLEAQALGHVFDPARKVDVAWALTDASAWLLVLLADQDPSVLAALESLVAAIDARASL